MNLKNNKRRKKSFRPNFEQQLEGMVTLCVQREQADAVLTLLYAEKITLYHLVPEQKYFYFTILLDDFQSVQRLLRKQHIRFHINQKWGMPFLISRWKRRHGIWIGLVCTIILGQYLLSFLWSYEVTGNERYSDDHIIALVQQYGLVQGRSLKQFDYEALEHKIELNHPEFTWIQLEAKGTTLFISVKERLTDGTEIQTSGSIIAKEDGKITELLIYTGTALVAEGDNVKKGQVLIGGWDYPNRIRNSAGQFVDVGEPYPQRANGVVRGYITHRAIATCALQEKWFAETGRSATCIDFLWKEYCLFSIGEKTSPYTYSKNDIEIKSLFQIGAWQCPIKTRTVTYQEQTVLERTFTSEEAYQTAIERARRQLQEIQTDESVFVRESCGMHRTAEDGAIQAEVIWVLEEPIGEYRQIPLPVEVETEK